MLCVAGREVAAFTVVNTESDFVRTTLARGLWSWGVGFSWYLIRGKQSWVFLPLMLVFQFLKYLSKGKWGEVTTLLSRILLFCVWHTR